MRNSTSVGHGRQIGRIVGRVVGLRPTVAYAGMNIGSLPNFPCRTFPWAENAMRSSLSSKTRLFIGAGGGRSSLMIDRFRILSLNSSVVHCHKRMRSVLSLGVLSGPGKHIQPRSLFELCSDHGGHRKRIGRRHGSSRGSGKLRSARLIGNT